MKIIRAIGDFFGVLLFMFATLLMYISMEMITNRDMRKEILNTMEDAWNKE